MSIAHATVPKVGFLNKPYSPSDLEDGLLDHAATLAVSDTSSVSVQNSDAEGESHGHEAPSCFPAGSVVSSTFILACTSMGLGVFSFPAVFQLCGIGGAAALLLAFAFLSAYAQTLAIAAAESVGVKTYEECTKQCLGQWGLFWQTACLAIGPFIANCAHVQAVGSLLGDSLIWFVTGKMEENGDEFHLPDSRKIVLYLLILAIPLPFSFMDNLNSLRHISLASIMLVLLNAVWFVVYCLVLLANGDAPTQKQGGPDSALPAFTSDFGDYFRAMGAICFAFSSANVIFPTVDEMDDKRASGRPILYSTLVCLVVYFGTGVAGAMTFGTGAQSNCLYNVKGDDRVQWWGNLPLVFGLLVCILLLYPIINYPMVTSVQALVWGPGEAYPSWSRGLISCVGVVGVGLVDYFVTDLVDLFGLCGSLGLGSTAYMLPALCYLGAEPRSWCDPHAQGAVIVLVVGLTVTTVSTVFTIQHIIQ